MMSINYREVRLRSKTKEATETEILYELAAAKVDGVEFVKLIIDTTYDGTAGDPVRKLIGQVIRTLKNMKVQGKIQFFATESNFATQSTEAIFLINKYPSYFDELTSVDGEESIYVKL